MEELNTVMEAKEEMAQRCHVLDLQVSTTTVIFSH